MVGWEVVLNPVLDLPCRPMEEGGRTIMSITRIAGFPCSGHVEPLPFRNLDESKGLPYKTRSGTVAIPDSERASKGVWGDCAGNAF